MSLKNKIKTFFTMDEEYDYAYEEQDEQNMPEGSKGQHRNQNVVNLKSIEQPSSKVILCEPRSYNEAQEIADNIVNRRAVVINLQRVDHAQAKRIIDFLSGTVYAVNGDIQKLGGETFLCTPDNVDVSGTISEAFVNEDEFEKGW